MEKKEWENGEIDENSNVWTLKLKIKILHQDPMRFLNGLSINQLGKESNSLEIGSQAGRVNTHRAMDKKKLFKIPKAN